MASIWTQKFDIHGNQLDYMCRWRISSIFAAAQEAATAQLISQGCDQYSLNEKNSGMAWMLVRMYVEVYDYPKNETVFVKTWPGTVDKITFPRYFTMERGDGSAVAKASSSWILVDTASRKILRPSAINTGLEIPDIAPAAAAPKRHAFSLPVSYTLHRKASYEDIDLNGHMNNVRYIDWVADALPFQKVGAQRISSINVNYAHETLPGQDVLIQVGLNGDLFEAVFLDESGKRLFEANGTFFADTKENS